MPYRERQPLMLLLALFFFAAVMARSSASDFSAQAPAGSDGYRSHVEPFLKANCLRCHGPDKSKGEIVLHMLDGRLDDEEHVELWERVLEKLESGEMPPEDAPQPSDAQRAAVAAWIDAALRRHVAQSGQNVSVASARRLTNIEYENTLRVLLGFELNVIDDLPEDPEKFYHFNNTAELMRMGPEQLDRYLDIARRAMKSAIVDGEKPEVYKIRREWSAAGNDRGMGQDEVGVWGNRRNTAAGGIGLKGFPKTGQFRIRMEASAIIPAG